MKKNKKIKTVRKGLNYYMSLNYPVTVEKFEENGTLKYGLQIPDLSGVWSSGDNLEEAYAELNDTKRLWFKTCIEKNVEIPEPISDKDFSGKFILRLNPHLHMALHKSASKNKISLNQHIRNLLEHQVAYNVLIDNIGILVEKVENMNGKISLMEHRIKSIEQVLSSYYRQPVLTATSLGKETLKVEGFMWSGQLDDYTFGTEKVIGKAQVLIECKRSGDL